MVPPEKFEEKVEEAVDCMTEKLSPGTLDSCMVLTRLCKGCKSLESFTNIFDFITSESPEFRICYGHLVDILEKLPDKQLDAVVAPYLAPVLVAENAPKVKAIVDGLEAVATNRRRGQELLVKYVFRRSTVSKEIVMRALHVCYTVKEPCQVSSK